jgi:type IV secretion system protein VirB2
MKKLFLSLAFSLVALSFFSVAHAAGSGMPWEDPLNKLLTSLTGPVAKVLGATSIIALGIGLAFSDGGSLAKKALWVVMGLAIAFNAVTWGITFLGFGSGLTF